MATPSYDDDLKAAALAALFAGQSFADVARSFRVPVGTLKSWKQRSNLTPTMDAPDASENRSRIGALLLEYLVETLETLKVQQRVFRDEEWLRKQSAAEAASLHGISLDKAVRLLEGLADESDSDVATDRPS
jgi:hypothetical protein